ncbi:hypothetical protein EA462_04845 [Natrarchaeobius halalkaliphilus]|uniref:Uncharacterized protein n=1 Tax=Natrarchaeobius halalkaliphilus TaxID=1679091 RepID=A0A3N6LUQ8_9EURY|nr:hypothetical protein [Natrarchaeobius halalkaliphilus]RQG91314.1 hypothetical protein EA462_04845 [Natrarchaeobius halalkaliphilus]
MNGRTVAGALGSIGVLVVVLAGIYGFAGGSVLESPDELLAPTVGTLAVATAVVAGLIALGTRSVRRRTPYW